MKFERTSYWCWALLAVLAFACAKPDQWRPLDGGRTDDASGSGRGTGGIGGAGQGSGTGGNGGPSSSVDAPEDVPGNSLGVDVAVPVDVDNGNCVAPQRLCSGDCVPPDQFCGGTCGNGFYACKGTCTAGAMPTEKCDGTDNDCDDQVDEGNLCEAPVNGTASCNGAQGCAKVCNPNFKECDGKCIGVAEICGTMCSAGFYACRGTCVAGSRPAEKCDGQDNDCNGTVDDGNLCPAPANGTASCGGASGCQSRCNANFRECGGVCASCPNVPNGSVGCQGTSCVMTGCGGGFRNCGGSCVTCPNVSNGQVGCAGNSCVLTGCNGGFYRDGDVCRACGASDPAHCGSSCRQCASDQDCRQGTCVARCTPGCQNNVEVTCSGGNATMKPCSLGCASGKCRECGSGQVECNGRCQQCCDTGDCPAGQTCQSGNCRVPCPTCNTNVRCDGSGRNLITTERCDANTNGQCVPVMQTCARGCTSGRCRECNSKSDCGLCKECNTGTGQCVNLTEDPQCGDSRSDGSLGACKKCISGTCQNTPISDQRDCDSGAGFCNGGRCNYCGFPMGSPGDVCCPSNSGKPPCNNCNNCDCTNGRCVPR